MMAESAMDAVEAAKRRIARPATALLVMASIQSVFPAIILVCGMTQLWTGGLSRIEFLQMLIACVHFCSLLLIAIGAAKMGFLESYTWGKIAAIMACIPFVTTFVFVGIPFGIWALRLLATPEIIQAFQAADQRRKALFDTQSP